MRYGQDILYNAFNGFLRRTAYGKARQVMSGYYFDDCSLNEIAEEHSITRQAVQDMIKRSERLLEQYEKKLMLVDKYLYRVRLKDDIIRELDALVENNAEGMLRIKSLVDHITD